MNEISLLSTESLTSAFYHFATLTLIGSSIFSIDFTSLIFAPVSLHHPVLMNLIKLEVACSPTINSWRQLAEFYKYADALVDVVQKQQEAIKGCLFIATPKPF